MVKIAFKNILKCCYKYIYFENFIQKYTSNNVYSITVWDVFSSFFFLNNVLKIIWKHIEKYPQDYCNEHTECFLVINVNCIGFL